MTSARSSINAGPGLLLLAVLVLAGCDSQMDQEAFAEQANRPPQGITRTTSNGEVLDEDPDDWRSAPFYIGKVSVSPAYPNPATAASQVILPVSVLQFGDIAGGLALRAFDATGRLILLAEEPDAVDPGGYDLIFPAALLGRTGLHRLYLFDSGTGDLVSYGDLRLE